ncbi:MULTISPECIES: hypothetical protein [Siminovitchia]|uniref:Uncharacterized protein n=1 Tax=Siminovitchia sediminis TaxID=1274353 RepID=A0ABW4KK36_9BACI|nr:hypothetical protein [Siminovitchia fortis]
MDEFISLQASKKHGGNARIKRERSMIENVQILFKVSPYRKSSNGKETLRVNMSPYWEKQFDDMFKKW